MLPLKNKTTFYFICNVPYTYFLPYTYSLSNSLIFPSKVLIIALAEPIDELREIFELTVFNDAFSVFNVLISLFDCILPVNLIVHVTIKSPGIYNPPAFNLVVIVANC